MHLMAMDFGHRILAVLPAPRRVLEIGSRNINGSLREMVSPEAEYVGIDLHEGSGVDTVADATTFQMDSQPDLIICTEVLEHTPLGREIIENAAHQLASGGHLLVTCATDPRQPHSARDGGPLRTGEYYCNVSEQDLCHWIISAGLTSRVIEIYDDRGDLYMLASKP